MLINNITVKVEAVVIKYNIEDQKDIMNYINSVQPGYVVERSGNLYVYTLRDDSCTESYKPGDNIVFMNGEYWNYSDEELAEIKV